MLIPVVMAAGAVALVVAWRLVDLGKVSIWPAMSTVAGAAGVAALATRRITLSGRVTAAVAAFAGVGAGVVLYGATTGFVVVVRRWRVFDRHVAEIYDQRRGLSLGVALLLAAAVNASGEELFWRGLWPWRLAGPVGWVAGAALAWAAYVMANTASRSLPIIAGAVVGGAAWAGLGLWTRGVLAPLLCHAVWTALMLAVPPGGPRAVLPGRAGWAVTRGRGS